MRKYYRLVDEYVEGGSLAVVVRNGHGCRLHGSDVVIISRRLAFIERQEIATTDHIILRRRCLDICIYFGSTIV